MPVYDKIFKSASFGRKEVLIMIYYIISLIVSVAVDVILYLIYIQLNRK